MREWILQNTTVTETEYDSLINPDTVSIKGKSKTYSISEISNHPLVNIALFTTEKPSFFNRKKYKILKKKDVNKKNYYIYQEIAFYILSEFIKNLPYNLHSTKRHHQCFHLNATICLMLNIKSYLITSLCQSPYHKQKTYHIHTFTLIVTKDNQEYIIDGTANIIMKKDTYFDIFKPQIISCIEKEKLQKDFEFIIPLENEGSIYKAEYYCFPQQTMEGAKKHLRKRDNSND